MPRGGSAAGVPAYAEEHFLRHGAPEEAMMVSISQQVALMRQVWPGFQVRGRTSWLVTWEGRLRPFHQSYHVKVFYCLGRYLDTVEILQVRPRVTVLDPVLMRRPEDPDEPIPACSTSTAATSSAATPSCGSARQGPNARASACS